MTHARILIHQMTYHLTTGKPLFKDLSLQFTPCKTGLVGKNGIGKSTLLKLIMGKLQSTTGSIHVDGRLAYVLQNPIISDELTVASILGCEQKIHALHRILEGSTDEKNFVLLDDDWDVEKRNRMILNPFGLMDIPLLSPLHQLSGGEITRLLLANAFSSDAHFLLLDEPTNHLDREARKYLYNAIQKWSGGIIVISHDRELLNLMDQIVEITTCGVFNYGGNYDAYQSQKEIEKASKEMKLEDAAKELLKAKNTIQSSREKHEKKQSYGRALRRSGSIDKMAAGSARRATGDNN